MYLYERNTPASMSGFQAPSLGEAPDASPTTQPVRLPRALPIFSEFELGKFALDARLAREVERFADQIVSSWGSAAQIRRVLLVGHTDDSGTPDLNLRLGKDRADAVKAKLLFEIEARSRRLSPTIDRRLVVDTETRGLTQPITRNPARRALNRRVEAFVFTSMVRQVPPPPPPPQPDITNQPPPPRPTDVRPPDPPIVPPPWQPPRKPPPHLPPFRDPPPWGPNTWRPKGAPPPTQPGPGSGIVDWIKTSLTAGAAALGIVYTGSVWAIRKVTLEKAIEAAWLVFQIEQGGLKALVGLAGEAALEAILPDALSIDPRNVLNLNSLVTSFPLLDIMSSRGLYSVKTYGIVSKAVGAELLDQAVSKYKNDFFAMIFDQGARDTRTEQCVRYLFDNQTDLRARGVWPRDLRGRTEQAIRKYVQEESFLIIPKDHVQPVRKALGKHLNQMRLSGQLRGVDPTWIQKQVFRIEHAGLGSGDLSGIVEATKHLPKDVYERLHREHDQLIRARRRRQGP